MDFNFSELKQDTHTAMNNPLSLNLGGEHKESGGGAAPGGVHNQPDHSPKDSDGKKSTGSSLDDDWLVHGDDSKITEQAGDDFGDFLATTKDTVKHELSDFGHAVSDKFEKEEKKGSEFISDMTRDFMNAERGFFGSGPAPAKAEEVKPVAPAAPVVAPVQVAPVTPAVPAGVVPSAPIPDDDSEDDDDDLVKPKGGEPKNSKFYDDFADNDSPSISYNPSPIKKNPVAAALKEQDNEKFISSEDLLGDFKEERTATPEFVPAKNPASSGFAEEVDDLLGDFKKPAPVEVKKPEPAQAPAPAPAPIPAPVVPAPVVQPSKVEEVPSVPVKSAPPVPIQTPAPSAPPAVPARKAPSPVATPAAAAAEPSTSGGPKIVSVEEIFYKYGLDVWFKPERLHPRVESLIYWRDVKKSGIVFGAGLITLLAISCFSVISVFAYLSLIALAGTIAFRIYKTVMTAIQKTSEGHPFKEYLEFDLTISQERVQQVTSVAVAHVNGFTAELRRLFLVEDLVDSLKFGVILWFMTYIGAWFNGMTLVMLAFVSLFTLPKIYENNKQSIDSYLDLVRTKVTEITDNIQEIKEASIRLANEIRNLTIPYSHFENIDFHQCGYCMKWLHYDSMVAYTDDKIRRCIACTRTKPVKSSTSIDRSDRNRPTTSREFVTTAADEHSRPLSSFSNKSRRISTKRELQLLEEQRKLDQEYLKRKYELLTLADEDGGWDDNSSMTATSPTLTEKQLPGCQFGSKDLPTTDSEPLANLTKSQLPVEQSLPKNLPTNSDQPLPMPARQSDQPLPVQTKSQSLSKDLPLNGTQENQLSADESLSKDLPTNASKPLPTVTKSQLPPLQDLPIFDGVPEKWAPFINTYRWTTEIYGLTDAENLVRLRSALKGRAFESVQDNLIHHSTVPEAISRLETLFGRKAKNYGVSMPMPYALMYKSIFDFADERPKEFNNWMMSLAKPTESERLSPVLRNKSGACPICNQMHTLANCIGFKKLSYREKWNLVETIQICEACLSHNKQSECNQKKFCGVNDCKSKHHALLHVERNFNNLAIPVTLYAGDMSVNVVAFFDYENPWTLLDKRVAITLKLDGVKSPIVRENDSYLVSLEVSPKTKQGDKLKRFPLRQVRTYEFNLWTKAFCAEDYQQKYAHLKGLPLTSYNKVRPTLLIGNNNKSLGTPLKLIEGKLYQPVAIKTRLGWIVSDGKPLNSDEVVKVAIPIGKKAPVESDKDK